MKIQANMRTRAMRLVVFAAALALLLVSGLVGGAIWIAATPGDQDRLEEYQWSAFEQAQRDQAIAAQDSSLLPACTEDYFAWREETKADRESAGRSEPVETDFWSAPGCRGTPDQLVQGPSRSPRPEMPTASSQDSPVIDVDYDDSWVQYVPEVIGGHQVLYIDTPKSRACSSQPVITLLTPKDSVAQFLGAPPDVDSLIRSVPGLPPDISLSFTNNSLDTEAKAGNDEQWNARMVRNGCLQWMHPDGGIHD